MLFNERLFLELLDWNNKTVQCASNIELKIFERNDIHQNTLLQSFKIKRPRRPLPGEEFPLLPLEEAQEIVEQIVKNVRYFRIFDENFRQINDALVRFNTEMTKIHQSTVLTSSDIEYIHTVAQILKDKFPIFFINKSKNYAFKIDKVESTLNELTQEKTKENLNYQKDFSIYLVQCFEYIFNACNQLNYKIDSFFGVKDYLKQKK